MIVNGKYLVYELFSGVGFCNQLFSLETAIYLANVTNRRLLLIVRHALCHIGSANWNYGKILEFFDDDYRQYLPQGIEVFYGSEANNKMNIIKKQGSIRTLNLGNFSGIVFCDRNLRKNCDATYLSYRKLHELEPSDFKEKYIQITRSNASRCFYNFYTSPENFRIMSKICASLTNFSGFIKDTFETVQLPKKYIAVHFRFGDLKHTADKVENFFTGKYDNFLIKLNRFNPDRTLPIFIMADRKDTSFFKRLQNEKFNFVFTDDISKKYMCHMNKPEVFYFLIEKYICEQSDIFIGSEGSTVSNQIQYERHLAGKACNYYVNSDISYEKGKNSWNVNNISGIGVGWKVYFKDNVHDILENTNMITLTNDGYMHYTKNLLESMKRLGIETLMHIYCIGSSSYNLFRTEFPKNKVYQIDAEEKLHSFIEYKAPQNNDVEGKKDWANLTSYKYAAIHKELKNGNDIVFVDGDIVFEKNPMSKIKTLLKENVDTELFIQNDSPKANERCCMCTGFFWMKSNRNTISITDFKTIRKNIDSFTNDQQYLRRFTPTIKHKYFSQDEFPNGKYFRDLKPTNPYIIHFNYDVSNQKIQRMRTYNKWYLKEFTPEQLKIENKSSNINNTILSTNNHIIDPIKTGEPVSLQQSIKNNGKLDPLYRTTVSRCSWIDLYYGIFSKIINENNFKNAVEVGVGYGTQAREILDNTKIEHLYLVDPFIKYNDYFSIDVEKLGGFNTLIKNMHILLENDPNRYSVIQRESLSVTEKEIPSNSIDIVFLDADHSYDAMIKDLPFWYNKLREGGILLGNDYSRRSSGTQRAVDEFIRNRNLKLDFVRKGNYPIYKIIK